MDKIELVRKEIIEKAINERKHLHKTLIVLQEDKKYIDGLLHINNTLRIQNKELLEKQSLELIQLKNDLLKYKNIFKAVKRLDEPDVPDVPDESDVDITSYPPLELNTAEIIASIGSKSKPKVNTTNDINNNNNNKIKLIMDKEPYIAYVDKPNKKRKKRNICKRCFRETWGDDICNCKYIEYVSGEYCKTRDCKNKLLETDFKCNLYATISGVSCPCKGKQTLDKCSDCGRWFHQVPSHPSHFVPLYCDFKAGPGRFKAPEDIGKIQQKIRELQYKNIYKL